MDDHQESRAIANLSVAFATLLLVLSATAVVYGITTYRSVKHNQIRRLALVAGLTARSTEATLRHYEHGLQVLGGQLRAAGVRRHPALSHALLLRFRDANPELGGLIVMSPQGQILAASNIPLGAPFPVLTGKNFALGLQDALASPRLTIGPTKRGTLTPGWIVPLHYAVRNSQGHPIFVLGVALPVSREQALWTNLPPSGKLRGGLLNDNGYLIFVWPPPVHPGHMYDAPQNGILYRTLHARRFPSSGYAEGVTALNRESDLVVYHRLKRYPLTLGITIPMSHVWREWARAVEVPYALELLLALAIAWTFLWTARHQSEWEQAQLDAREQLHGANRALRVLTDVNQSLIHAPDELTLLNQVCQSLVRTGGYRMAWAGYAENDEGKTIRPVAVAGHDDGYVASLDLTWADTPRGRGAAGVSIRERRPAVTRNIEADATHAPWHDAAMARGYASSISLPLIYGSHVFGSFCFYTDKPLAFDSNEVDILEQLANDVGYGIHTLRTRLAHSHAESQLRMAASALENTAEAVFITDARGRIIFINKAFTAITGFPEEEVIAQPWDSITSSRDNRSFLTGLRQSLDETGYWQGEFWSRRKNGDMYPALLSITKVPEPDGSQSHHVGVFNDISQFKDYQTRLEFLATHDALTGLPNRTLLRDRLDEAISRAQRDGLEVAVLFLDLDRFKSINDTLGHSVGDELLGLVATRLRNAVRDVDTVSRMGGDEFAIILGDCRDSSDVATLAHKLRELISHCFVVETRELFVTASIGISCYPQDGTDAATLLKNADIAMYRAKESGPNLYQFFSPDMNAQASEFMAMANSLHQAVERGEFMLEFQPRHELATGRITGVEALLRWRHPEIGLVYPDRFIPLAEETGIIVPLGEWALATACAQARIWERAGIRLPVAINLSTRQFRERDLVARIQAIIEASQVSPSLVEVEITESLMMQDPANASRMLGELRALGVESAIDDFGTGYSSLAYLKALPVKYLKIDQSFVRDLPGDPSDVAILRTIIAIARSLDLRLIAEGVENAAQRAFLLAEGCEQAQGYYFSRPMPAEVLDSLLAEMPREQEM